MTLTATRDSDELVVHVTDKDLIESLCFRVELTLEGDRRFEGELSLDDYSDPPATGDQAEIMGYGLALFNRLFSGSLSGAFQQAWAAARANNRRLRIRLWLDTTFALVHRVPWELMYYDDSGGVYPPWPLATGDATAFSRYAESREPEGEPIGRRPLRMLALISAPSDLADWQLAPLDREAERRDFDSRFSAIVSSGQFAYDFLPIAAEEQLHAALEEGVIAPQQPALEQPGYDVLLFYGHALHHPSAGSRLMLEDGPNRAGALYDGAELVGRLQQLPPGRRPSLVVLVACNTATLSEGPSLGNLALDLVSTGGVPAVLAMQRLVEIPLARAFTFHLADYLLRDGTIDIAVNAARRRVYQPDSLSWSTPVLYMRHRNGRLFAANPRVTYVQQLLAAAEFIRWSGSEFIGVEAITLPRGVSWSLIARRPDDAPPTLDVLTSIRRALQLEVHRPRPNLVALIGQPHSGQTTTLQRLTWDFAAAASKQAFQEAPIPIYASLIGYGQQRTSGSMLERLIIDAVAERAPALAPEIQRLFQSSPRPGESGPPLEFVFLLDGLDAIDEAWRHNAVRELIRLAERLRTQRFLVTCTQDVFPQSLVQEATVLVIQPLNERQVLRYLKQRDDARGAALFGRIIENRLLDLAAEPALLVQIYERIATDRHQVLTRNQLLQEVLDARLNRLERRYVKGDAARESLLAIAWALSWQHRDTLELREIFAILDQVRGTRDYSLEDLYQALRDERMLGDVGKNMVRFIQPTLKTYCSALALVARPDFARSLNDILVMCGVASRFAWWQQVIYTVAGMMDNPDPIVLRGKVALVENSGLHTLLLARSLEALSPAALKRISERDMQEVVDACVVQLSSEREPVVTRRAEIAEALGRIPHPQAMVALHHILTRKLLPSHQGNRYEHTSVRIAAARGLRTLLTRPETQALVSGASPDGPKLEPEVLALLKAWNEGDRTTLRGAVKSRVNTAPERAVAAFALGDLAATLYDVRSLGTKRYDAAMRDALSLFEILVGPRPKEIDEEEWADTMWSSADALTMFDAELVSPILVRYLQKTRPRRKDTLEQLVYLAGRTRTRDPLVVGWLFVIAVRYPDYRITGKALQSLAWLGSALDGVRLAGIDRPLTSVLRQIARSIAAWRLEQISLPEPPGPFTLNLDDREDPRAMYLRRKAIESLTWIGSQQDLELLYNDMRNWPVDLREAWYLTMAALRGQG